MAAPVIETSTSNTSTGGTSLTLTKPSGVALDDLLIIIVGSDSDASPANQWGSLTGWTQMFDSTGTSPRCDLALYYRIADTTEGSSESPTHTESDELFGWYLRISGVDTTTPFDDQGTSNLSTTNSTTHNYNEVTTSVADCLLIAFGSFDGGDGPTFSVGTGTGWGTVNSLQGGTGANDVSGWYTTKNKSGTGLEGTLTITSAVADGSITRMIAIAPTSGTPLSADGVVATMTMTGQDATPAKQSPLSSSGTVATMTMAGQDATPSSAAISADGTAATVTMAGQAAQVGNDPLTADGTAAAMTFAGQDATVFQQVALSTDGTAAAMTFAGQDGTAALQVPISADGVVGTMTLGGQDATVSSAAISADGEVGTLTMTGQAAQVGNQALSADGVVATVTFAGQDATTFQQSPLSTDGTAAAMTFAGQDATVALVTSALFADGEVALLTMAGQAATGDAGTPISADGVVGLLTMAGQAATVSSEAVWTDGVVALVTMTGQDAVGNEGTPLSADGVVVTVTLTPQDGTPVITGGAAVFADGVAASLGMSAEVGTAAIPATSGAMQFAIDGTATVSPFDFVADVSTGPTTSERANTTTLGDWTAHASSPGTGRPVVFHGYLVVTAAGTVELRFRSELGGSVTLDPGQLLLWKVG